MENKEILEKIFYKAYGNLNKFNMLDFENDLTYEDLLINNFLFSHDFAQAFFGMKRTVDCNVSSNEEYFLSDDCPLYVWQWHLQQMVLLDEPLKYLEKYL